MLLERVKRDEKQWQPETERSAVTGSNSRLFRSLHFVTFPAAIHNLRLYYEF